MTIEFQVKPTAKRMVSVLIAGLTFFTFTVGAAAQHRKAGGTPAKKGSQRYVSIDFNNVDIGVFIKFISELTHKNFIVDQRVRGKVTIISPSKISVDEAYKVFESVLDVHGFATVPTGDVIKIVPAADARTKNLETLTKKPKGASDNDQLVTQLIPLHYADPDDIKRLFTPMVSRGSVILSYDPTNTLIITDNYSNIARLMKILKTIDVPGVGREITVLPIHHADATKLLTLLETVFKSSGRAVRKTPTELNRQASFVADERTNSIILVASEEETDRIRSLVRTLDRQTPKGKEKTHVYYLQYAVADDLAAVLKDLPKGEKGKTGAAAKLSAAALSGKVSITPDKATNSLIITADRDDYATLEDIIKKIDIPRAMVYIEALIMEVDATKSFNLGTEWIAGTNTDLNNGRKAIVGGGFTKDSSNLQFDSSGNLIPSLPSGMSLGLFGQAVDIGGISFPSIAAIVQAYKKDTDVNILSTPQLLTTDNQEASITVAENIPYQTTTSTSNNNTYNSFEYRDVGKILKITPQISKGRMVRLKLSLEVSSLLSTATQTTQPTTSKRTVDTTVMVKDGGTVVIGGLIDDSYNQTDYKVPCLGDIPGFGWLFRSLGKDDDKKNLYIFITPKVVETPEEAKAIYKTKKTQIDRLRETQIKLYGGGENTSMTLPAPTGPQNDPPAGVTTDKKDQGGRDGGAAGATIDPAADASTAAVEPNGGGEAGQYIVQVQSFADEMSALEAVARLKKLGQPAHIKQTDVKGKIWYRVQIGGFPDRTAAESTRKALSAKGFTGAYLIKNEP